MVDSVAWCAFFYCVVLFIWSIYFCFIWEEKERQLETGNGVYWKRHWRVWPHRVSKTVTEECYWIRTERFAVFCSCYNYSRLLLVFGQYFIYFYVVPTMWLPFDSYCLCGFQQLCSRVERSVHVFFFNQNVFRSKEIILFFFPT